MTSDEDPVWFVREWSPGNVSDKGDGPSKKEIYNSIEIENGDTNLQWNRPSGRDWWDRFYRREDSSEREELDEIKGKDPEEYGTV